MKSVRFENTPSATNRSTLPKSTAPMLIVIFSLSATSASSFSSGWMVRGWFEDGSGADESGQWITIHRPSSRMDSGHLDRLVVDRLAPGDHHCGRQIAGDVQGGAA